LQRPRTQNLWIGAAVVALHAVICWLLLEKIRVLRAPEVARSLELIWIPPSPPRAPAASPEEPRKETSKASKPARRPPPERSATAPRETPAPAQGPAAAPPIDWQAELAREAAASASAKPEHRFKEFDFPRRSAPASRAPEFAWDRNHIHRVETAPGALLVHLNDHCVFVMTPLPFLLCSPFKHPANGNLFEHMKDPVSAASGAQP